MFTRLSDASWFKINLAGKVIYIDPGYFGTFQLHGLPIHEFEEPGDIILISHAHNDHLQPEALAKIRKPTSFILAPKVCEDIIDTPFCLIKPGDEIIYDGFKIQAVHAYNTPEGHSTVKAHHKGEGVGFIVQASQLTFYHSGDTDFIPEMKFFPPIDVAMIPIGGTYTMDVSEAAQAVLAIKPKMVIPMHFLKADPADLVRLLEKQSSNNVLICEPGKRVGYLVL